MDRVSFKARGRIAELISNPNVTRTLSNSIRKSAVFFIVSLGPNYCSDIVRSRAFPFAVRMMSAVAISSHPQTALQHGVKAWRLSIDDIVVCLLDTGSTVQKPSSEFHNFEVRILDN